MTPRRRIGVLLPSTNSTVEPDFNMVAPAGVSIHAQRLWLTNEMSPESTDRMNTEVEDGARYLATAAVELVGYFCTGGTFYRGPDYDVDLVRRIAEAAAVPALSTASVTADALRSLGAERISVVTPYLQWENDLLRAYYEALGFELLNVDGDPQASAAGNRGNLRFLTGVGGRVRHRRVPARRRGVVLFVHRLALPRGGRGVGAPAVPGRW